MSELKPCPFCGSEVELQHVGHIGWVIDCPTCERHHMVADKATKYIGKDGLVEWWNTRHERTCENVYGGREFECSECGMQWHLLDRTDATEEWAHVRTPGFCPSCGAKVVI